MPSWAQNLDFTPPQLGHRRFLAPGRFAWLRILPWTLVFTLVMIVLYGLSGLPLLPMLEGGRGSIAGVALICLTTAALAGLYAFVVWVTEARWPSELSLRQAVPHTLIGLATGFVLIALSVVVLFAFGQYQYVGFVGAPPWTFVALAVTSGVGEEIVMRGVLLRLLMRLWGAVPALLISSLVFGFLHMGNPDSSLWSSTAISIEAGLVLGGAYLLTGRLWVPIGLHAGWNFTQGYVFGADVSGVEVNEVLFDTAPMAGTIEWISGGGFGPEGSLPAFVICTSAGLWMTWAAWKAGHFRRSPSSPADAF